MRGIAQAAVALALAIAGAGDGPIPDREISVEVLPGAESVEFGKVFPLTVVRVWEKRLSPEDWKDEGLAPLVLRLVEVSRREDDRHVEETRLFEARAFALGDVAIPPTVFRARAKEGGAQRVAMSAEATLRVLPSLDPANPGPPELPRGLYPEPSPEPSRSNRLLAGLAALALTGATLLVWALRRRRRPAASPSAPEVPAPPPPHLRALERLRRLRGLEPRGPGEFEFFYVEAAAAVRDYLVERFTLRTRERTSEEVLEAPETVRAIERAPRDLLATFLRSCDFVKFGRIEPTALERDRDLDSAERFLRATANGAPADGAASGSGVP